MTWEHLQQLRDTAKAEIQRCLELKRPRGGRGVNIQGTSISIHSDRIEDDEPPPLMISIWVSIETTTTHTKAGQTTTSEFSFPLELYVQVQPNGSLRGTYAHEKTRIFSLTDGGMLNRVARITFEQRPFLFPVVLRLEQRDLQGNVYDKSNLPMPAGRAIYNAQPAASEVVLEVHVAGISSL